MIARCFARAFSISSLAAFHADDDISMFSSRFSHISFHEMHFITLAFDIYFLTDTIIAIIYEASFSAVTLSHIFISPRLRRYYIIDFHIIADPGYIDIYIIAAIIADLPLLMITPFEIYFIDDISPLAAAMPLALIFIFSFH
jgi:hypothetical protein